MRFFKVILTTLALSSIVACSDGGGGSSGGDNNAPRDDFRNTASPESFKEKAQSGRAIYDDVAKLKGDFRGTRGAKMAFLFQQNEQCWKTSEYQNDDGDTVIAETCINRDTQEQCLVTTVKDAAGNEKSRERQCFGDPSDPANPSNPTNPSDPNKPDPSDPEPFPSDGSDGGGLNDGSLTPDLGSFLPTMGDISDCDEAFRSIDSLYDNAKAEYTEMLKLLENPDALKTPGLNLTQGAADGSNAVVYDFSPEQNVEGLTISGRLAGGASEDQVRISTGMTMEIDFAKFMQSLGAGAREQAIPQASAGSEPQGKMRVSQNASVLADLKARRAQFDIDAAFHMEGGGEGMPAQGAAIKGSIIVSAGDEKFVTQKLDFAGTGAAEQAIKTDLTAKLISPTKIVMEGSISGVGVGQGDTTWSYVIERPEGGTCKVSQK